MRNISRQPSDQDAARIRPLTVLPVFLDLAGKRAVVAGGSAAACWKAELLLSAGAKVFVHAPDEDLCEDFAKLIERHGPAALHHGRSWDRTDLAGAAVAICDARDEQEAAAFAAAAAAAGVPCNVIDQPAFCSIQFGAIVNRSPVVIGISTTGAAPILGQAIRRRIETLLMPPLAEWAALAARIRGRVAATLNPGAERRRFWERLAERAFGDAPGPQVEQELFEEARTVGASRVSAGRVTLVGAGPGEAELLTLKAVRALQSADVILFDDLVSDEVLELARREAKRIQVGKRGGRPSCRQEDINALMLTLAKAGRHVVRLKSGDPMIFGRAGEEIAMLEAAGIPVAIVPGISAGVALASALRMSLTHRDHAKSVRFVTGHSRNGGLPEDLNWRSIADPSATTIFYMGGRNAGQIADRLISLGVPASMPVAVGAGLGRREQQLRIADLATLGEAVNQMNSDQPIVIGVGRAFAQHRATGLERDPPLPVAATG
ncbi:siroheme synthase CysG [Xanthobacter sp. V7C-4]|uniref:siroheme synthase CysG n=1 Tax=Xanthobacter autotrophicus (strain ATCC BAA-1158 / Py2) TaxID=78245 RepID=UPI00372A227D